MTAACSALAGHRALPGPTRRAGGLDWVSSARARSLEQLAPAGRRRQLCAQGMTPEQDRARLAEWTAKQAVWLPVAEEQTAIMERVLRDSLRLVRSDRHLDVRRDVQACPAPAPSHSVAGPWSSGAPRAAAVPTAGRPVMACACVQVLSATRNGPCGVPAINRILQGMLNPAAPDKQELERLNRVLRKGDRVMQASSSLPA